MQNKRNCNCNSSLIDPCKHLLFVFFRLLLVTMIARQKQIKDPIAQQDYKDSVKYLGI